MIAGIGTDIVGMERIGRLLKGRTGEAFARRVLTDAERTAANERRSNEARYIEFIAGRWAAKEAVSKALGCGIGAAVGFHDIEVLPDLRGKPLCSISDAAWSRLGSEKWQIHVSISHADGWAAAFAVAEQ